MMALMILAVRVAILAMYDTRQATNAAGQARVRLWMAMCSAEESGQGRVWLRTFRGAQWRSEALRSDRGFRGRNLGNLV
jgi:hypothetical protein